MRFVHFGTFFPVRVSNFCVAPNSRGLLTGLLTIFSFTLVFVIFVKMCWLSLCFRFFLGFVRNFRVKNFHKLVCICLNL